MQKIKDRLIQIFDFYGIEEKDVVFEEKEEGGKITLSVTLPDDAAKHLIGSHGETLEALETVVRLAHLDELKEGQKLVVDINGYRAEREAKLQEKAVEIARQVLETQREYVFNDLNAYERYLVHTAISQDPELKGVETHSEDDTYGRVLVVKPAA